MKVCAVDDCDKPARAKGMCDTHYRRWRKAGWTEAEREYEREKKRERDRKRRAYAGCVICDAARLLDARGYSLHEAARQQRKAPAWLRQHLDDHGLSDVLSHREMKETP